MRWTFWICSATAVEYLGVQQVGDFVAGQRACFLNFYTPWCAHCKSVSSEFAQANQLVSAGKKINVGFAQIDASEDDQGLLSEYSITQFPTLILAIDGLRIRYQGHHLAGVMTGWLVEVVSTFPKRLTTVDDLDSWKAGNTVGAVAFVTDRKSPLYQLAIGQGCDEYEFAYAIASDTEEGLPELFQSVGLNISAQAPPVSDTLFYHVSEFEPIRWVPYSLPAGVELPLHPGIVESFLLECDKHSLPPVPIFDAKAVHKLFYGAYPKVLVVVPPLSALTSDEAVEMIAQDLVPLRQFIRNDTLPVVMPLGSHAMVLGESFRLDFVALFNSSMMRTPKEEWRYVSYDVFSGVWRPLARSMVPLDPQSLAEVVSSPPNVPPVVAKDFPSANQNETCEIEVDDFPSLELASRTRPVLLMIHAQWCAHSMAFLEVWEAFRSLASTWSTLHVCSLVAPPSADLVLGELPVNHFPSLWLFGGRGGAPVEYVHSHSAEGIEDWLRHHGVGPQ
mmetsp:Transcript_57030/g.152349  ORF Transcript_57030/g.152349 Transcript_57030/m.152349 type:complete len:504 (-) Transcript_57030:39-1550(-)